MHTKFERLLSKSLTTLEVMSYYLVVHTGHEEADRGNDGKTTSKTGLVLNGGSGKNGTGKNGTGENGTRKKWLPVIMDECRILKVLLALGKKKGTGKYVICLFVSRLFL